MLSALAITEGLLSFCCSWRNNRLLGACRLYTLPLANMKRTYYTTANPFCDTGRSHATNSASRAFRSGRSDNLHSQAFDCIPCLCLQQIWR